MEVCMEDFLVSELEICQERETHLAAQSPRRDPGLLCSSTCSFLTTKPFVEIEPQVAAFYEEAKNKIGLEAKHKKNKECND